MTQEVSKWADAAMFRAEPVDAEQGPRVYLLEMTSDPLGSVAALSAMYTGKVTRSKDDVTEEDRAHHLREMQLTHLKTPLEAVKLHFMIEGVTRAFTHQLVRNRTSAFAQESMRFAVKEDMPVALPPHLFAVEVPVHAFDESPVEVDTEKGRPVRSWHNAYERLTDMEKKRVLWDECVEDIRQTYNLLVNMGMPAEDARGLAPTNVLTRINYVTDLRTLLSVLDVRLCTQAQFEWRAVATQMATAIADGYRMDRRWLIATNAEKWYEERGAIEDANDERNYKERVKAEYLAIARLFKPICYRTGKCEFRSDADRACTIRSRVDANHSIARDSSEWASTFRDPEYLVTTTYKDDGQVELDKNNKPIYIGPIGTAEWLMDPKAAIA